MSERGTKEAEATEVTPTEERESGKAEATLNNVAAEVAHRRGQGIWSSHWQALMTRY